MILFGVDMLATLPYIQSYYLYRCTKRISAFLAHFQRRRTTSAQTEKVSRIGVPCPWVHRSLRRRNRQQSPGECNWETGFVVRVCVHNVIVGQGVHFYSLLFFKYFILDKGLPFFTIFSFYYLLAYLLSTPYHCIDKWGCSGKRSSKNGNSKEAVGSRKLIYQCKYMSCPNESTFSLSLSICVPCKERAVNHWWGESSSVQLHSTFVQNSNSSRLGFNSIRAFVLPKVWPQTKQPLEFTCNIFLVLTIKQVNGP